MQLYPAIDMKNGQCVRLRQGAFADMTVYGADPAQMALKWQEAGASFLHLVDLDGALAGRSVNEAAIRSILSSVSVPVQIGGGIRTEAAVEYMLSLGVQRVIIGTKAAEEPEFLKKLVDAFGADRVAAGIDAKNGMVAVHGWEQVSGISAVELCRKMQEYGVRHIVYTDISRDGMLTGPNVEATRRLREETGLDIIASGGVSCMQDLENLHEAGIPGAIIGKALYEGRIDLRAAVERFEQRNGEICI